MEEWLNVYPVIHFHFLRCFDTVFGTIPNFLNRLLDSPFLVRSKWNLQYLLLLDWTLAWFTFCENRYFHDNDKQKNLENTKIEIFPDPYFALKSKCQHLKLWCMAHKIYKNKKNAVCLYWSKSQKHFQHFLTMCPILVSSLVNIDSLEHF